MAISEQRAVPEATGEPARPPARPVVDAAELLVLAAGLLGLAAGLGVGWLAWAGLVLANAGRYSLPAAAGLALLAGAGAAVIAWRSEPRPRLAIDRGSLAVLLGVGLLAAVLFFPGFA